MPILILIKYYYDGYFLSFVVEVRPEVLSETDNSIGIDLGIKTKASCRDVLLILGDVKDRFPTPEKDFFSKP